MRSARLLAALFMACLLAAIVQRPVLGQESNSGRHLYLVPENPSGIQLLAHVAEIEVQQSAGYTTNRSTKVLYKLLNKQSAPVELLLAIQPAAEAPLDALMLSVAPVVVRNGAPIPIVQLPSGETGYVLQFAPDERTELTLTYLLTGDSSIFPSVSYSIEPLRRWGTPPDSVRVSILTDFTSSSRNVQVLWPQGYEVHNKEFRWHWEKNLPLQGPAIRFIHKASWDLIRTAEQSGDYVAQGQGLYSLYIASNLQGDQQQLFYDQALAAFLTAMSYRPLDAHIGLARLYRSRIEGLGTEADSRYLDLALTHAHSALDLLPEDRLLEQQELMRWIEEGLATKVRQATSQDDWATVDEALQALENLPEKFASNELATRIEGITTAEQALRLYAAGDVQGALHLGGEGILDPALLPASKHIPIFSGTLVDVMAGREYLNISMESWLHARHRNRLDEALATLEYLVVNSGSGALLDWSIADEGETSRFGTNRLQLQLSVDNVETAYTLADRLPADSEWLVLRRILANPWPSKQAYRRIVSTDTRWTYALDLTDTYSFWLAKAAMLDNRSVGPEDTDESGIVTKIRQSHIAHSASAWRMLAANTQVLVSLDVQSPNATSDAVWLANQDNPTILASKTYRTPDSVRLGLLVGWAATIVFALTFGTKRLLAANKLPANLENNTS